MFQILQKKDIDDVTEIIVPAGPSFSSASPLIKPKARSSTLILEEEVLERSGDFIDEDLREGDEDDGRYDGLIMPADINGKSKFHDEAFEEEENGEEHEREKQKQQKQQKKDKKQKKEKKDKNVEQHEANEKNVVQEVQEVQEEDQPPEEWTDQHESVGAKVSAVFTISKFFIEVLTLS